jgi:hypothetical protein
VNIIVKFQNAHLDEGVNLVERMFFCFKGRMIRMRIDATKAITPPNLLGIDRRIA